MKYLLLIVSLIFINPIFTHSQWASEGYTHQFETSQIQIVKKNGYTFHIANYADGTNIVTYLDGEERGLQGIIFNDLILGYSRNVQWYEEYFVHFYPNGKVTSYPNKQIGEYY